MTKMCYSGNGERRLLDATQKTYGDCSFADVSYVSGADSDD